MNKRIAKKILSAGLRRYRSTTLTSAIRCLYSGTPRDIVRAIGKRAGERKCNPIDNVVCNILIARSPRLKGSFDAAKAYEKYRQRKELS
jgi:hypothetical protein